MNGLLADFHYDVMLPLCAVFGITQPHHVTMVEIITTVSLVAFGIAISNAFFASVFPTKRRRSTPPPPLQARKPVAKPVTVEKPIKPIVAEVPVAKPIAVEVVAEVPVEAVVEAVAEVPVEAVVEAVAEVPAEVPVEAATESVETVAEVPVAETVSPLPAAEPVSADDAFLLGFDSVEPVEFFAPCDDQENVAVADAKLASAIKTFNTPATGARRPTRKTIVDSTPRRTSSRVKKAPSVFSPTAVNVMLR